MTQLGTGQQYTMLTENLMPALFTHIPSQTDNSSLLSPAVVSFHY